MRRGWVALLVVAGCDRELGPPPIAPNTYCADVCLVDPGIFGGEGDVNACADACEADPAITQELLNCLGDRDPVGRLAGCGWLFGAGE